MGEFDFIVGERSLLLPFSTTSRGSEKYWLGGKPKFCPFLLVSNPPPSSNLSKRPTNATGKAETGKTDLLWRGKVIAVVFLSPVAME